MASFPIKATSVVGPNGKSCDGTEPEKPCTGIVTLEQPNADTITITWDIKNLGEPGSKHGFHVHEKADFSDGCKSAGPHWNPLNLDHGAPEDEIRHVGGLGNIIADADGHSKGSMSDHQVKLFDHEKFGSVVGRSMMIHAKEDDLGLGDNSKANEPGPPQDESCTSGVVQLGPSNRSKCVKITWSCIWPSLVEAKWRGSTHSSP